MDMGKRKILHIFLFIFCITISISLTDKASSYNLSTETAHLINEVPMKKTYFDAGAVILLNETIMTVGKDGSNSYTTHVVGKILSEKAASDYGQVHIFFNSFYKDIRLDYAQTIKKDGQIIEVSKDALQIKTIPVSDYFTDGRLLAFSLSSLEKEAVFEFQYTVKGKIPVLNNDWFERFGFNYIHYNEGTRIDPVHKSRIAVILPRGKKFIYQVINTDATAATTSNDDFITYSWKLNDIQAAPLEMSMPDSDDITPRIELSSVNTWAEIDDWLNGLFAQKIEVTQEIKDKVRELSKGTDKDRERIKAFFYFIQKDIRYVHAAMNRGGYTPHTVTDILKNKYGDCKDQVVLFLSMLKAAGIKAYPAMINPAPSSDISRGVPAPWFMHVIVYIPRAEGDLWLDTTSGVTEYPNLLWANQDRWAFVVNGKGGMFVKTSSSDYEHNQGSITEEISFDGKTMLLKYTIDARGALSDNLKKVMQALPFSQRENIFTLNRSPLDSKRIPAKLKSVLSDIDDPAVSFKSTNYFELKDVLSLDQNNTFPYFGNAESLLDTFTHYINIPVPENRKHDFMSYYKFKLIQEHFCPPPFEDFRIDTLPQDKSFDNDLVSFSIKFNKEKEAVIVRMEIILKKSLIRKEEYKIFYDSIRKIREESLWQIVFSKQKIDTKEQGLEIELQKAPENSIAVLNLAKHYLSKGKYEDAFKLLEKAVISNPRNGEIYYFFGLALGYLDRNEESERAFRKAKDMGYRP